MQQPSSTLSQRGQVRRMTGLARQALEAYAVPAARVTPLKHVYNKTFRIATPSGEQYVLRMCHPRRTSVEVVQSELLWLAALRQDVGLNVPAPVQNKEMQYVTVITDVSVPRPYLCALFHWTTGRFLSRTLAPAHLLQVGELTARLHHHATQWERPAGFTRRRVDNLNPLRQERDDGFDETLAAQAIRAVAAVSTPQAGTVVAAVIQKVWAMLQALGEGPDTFGLIHADLHQRNYLFHNGRAGAIDFDDCGYGHWLYDLAVTLYCLTDHPHFAALKEAFLTGYRRSRPLSKEQETYLETFIALRTLQDLLWRIEERDQPAFRDRWHTQMLAGLQALREFIHQ
jgi:Ser/Thr protein kinase RdoA (MazF antagonist)